MRTIASALCVGNNFLAEKLYKFYIEETIKNCYLVNGDLFKQSDRYQGATTTEEMIIKDSNKQKNDCYIFSQVPLS